MLLGIGSYFNHFSIGSSGINKNGAQYKAVVKNSMAGILESEARMSKEQRLAYELFGGRDEIIKNKMKMYDSNGNLLNSDGVAGMDMTGKSLSEKQQIIGFS